MSLNKKRNILLFGFSGFVFLLIVFALGICFEHFRKPKRFSKQIIEAISYLEQSIDSDTSIVSIVDGKVMNLDSKAKFPANTYGYVTFEQKKRKKYAISNDVYCIQDGKVSDGRCEMEANKPELPKNFIPVKYHSRIKKWVTVSEDDPSWYNYEEQKWANIISVYYQALHDKYFDENGNYRIGVEVDSSDITMMYVWIPRYKYAIPKGEEGTAREISVVFEKGISTTGVDHKSKSSSVVDIQKIPNKEYYTHPAFTLGEKELSGIWIGKFEMGDNTNIMSDNLTALPLIKPNIPSLVYLNLSQSWTLIREKIHNTKEEPNLYGVTNDVDVHTSRNMEWASVSILSQSKYGKFGNKDYAQGDKEVFINNTYSYKENVSPFTTGCSAGNVYADTVVSCEYTYDVDWFGTGASTTGTIYGVYDMSGGAYEEVMGNLEGLSGNSDGHSSGFKGNYGKGGELEEGIPFPEEKYIDHYTEEVKSKKGDAMFYDDTRFWYDDYDTEVIPRFPWYVRGGLSSFQRYAGVFAYLGGCGGEVTGLTVRVVMTNR